MLCTSIVPLLRQAVRGLLAGEDGAVVARLQVWALEISLSEEDGNKKEGQILHLVGALPLSVGAL